MCLVKCNPITQVAAGRLLPLISLIQREGLAIQVSISCGVEWVLLSIFKFKVKHVLLFSKYVIIPEVNSYNQG